MEKTSETTREFTLRFLQDITNNFCKERIIGSGGCGVVYRGVLENGEEIAIKKLHYMPGLDDTQFRNEFNNLMRVQHRNITRLVGYCYHLGHERIMYNGEYVFAHVEERFLCFEYMQNGSLDKYISDESSGLDWRARYKIIKGVCEGLNYLHNGYKDPIYHMDLKPANILLDKDMTPKIGDLGLSRLFPSARAYTTIKLIGTPGYMPPEYIEKYEITSKFDVFSLGVIIIRIIAGDEGYSKRANMSSEEFGEDVHENWRKRMWEIMTSRTSLEVMTCIEIALRCVEANRVRRPTISEIVIELNEIDTVESSPISQGADDAEDDNGFEYSDDEPIVALPCSETRVQLMSKCRNKIPLYENRKKVTLQLTRSGSAGRLGLDMVIVLDISGSMQGKKIQEMKTTTKFIIDKLSHIDRLSIVTFSVVAARLCPLRLITESSQSELQGLIDSLTASGDTANIIDGLQIGLKVLADRKVSRGRVVAVMIMSDGLQINLGNQFDIDSNDVPVYTFGFGVDHDPTVLRKVADKSNGGTFSAVIQDMDGLSLAFSRCLDNLLTVVVQDLRLTVQSMKEEFIILIKVITDGSHTQAQDAHHGSGSVTISLGDLSSRDVHNVTVDLVPTATESECSTDILKITYSYSTFGELFVAPPFTMTMWRTSISPYFYSYLDGQPNMAWPAGDKYDVLIKLLLVGDSGVGKSTLLLQFTDGSFTPSFISTVSFDFKIRTVELDNRRVKLQVWDTAGQECFQTISTDMVQTITTDFNRTGILFVYDVTNESSFNNVRVWYKKIKEHSPYVNKILVGNRSDMDESKRAVTTSRGQALADEYGIRFFETSAKTYLNVEEAFLSLARDVIHRYNYWS